MFLQYWGEPFFLQRRNSMFLINGNILTPIWQPLCVLTATHNLHRSSNHILINWTCYRDTWVIVLAVLYLEPSAVLKLQLLTKDGTVLHVSCHDLTQLVWHYLQTPHHVSWLVLFVQPSVIKLDLTCDLLCLLLYLCSHVDAAFDLKANDYKRKGILPVGVS